MPVEISATGENDLKAGGAAPLTSICEREAKWHLLCAARNLRRRPIYAMWERNRDATLLQEICGRKLTPDVADAEIVPGRSTAAVFEVHDDENRQPTTRSEMKTGSTSA